MAVNQSFPAKIYQILENESIDIIRWNDDGQSFRIVDHGRFEREIVPKYFRHNQISSVQRQLNLYGFKCISRGELRRSFFHPKFKRGEWEVVKKLTRYIPPKKALPYQEYGSFNPLGNGNHHLLPSEFASSAASVVVLKEEPECVPQPQSDSHSQPPVPNWIHTAAGTVSAISAVATAAGLCGSQPFSMPFPSLTNPSAAAVSNPRNPQPSELALRLGFNVAPKPCGPLEANATRFSGIPASHNNSSFQDHSNSCAHNNNNMGSAAAGGSHGSFAACNHHGSNSDFDLIRDFDFFDNFHYEDMAANSAHRQQQHHQQLHGYHHNHHNDSSSASSNSGYSSQAACASSSPVGCSSADSSADSVSTASSRHTEVVPVLSMPAPTEKKDACCMTDLIFSEKHGGFIYSSQQQQQQQQTKKTINPAL